MTAGGLPLEQDGTTHVSRFRDDAGGIRRQAARFQIYAYDSTSPNGRPVGPGLSNIKDIQWTVHLANKKSSWYEFQQLTGSDGNHTGQPLRNPRTLGQGRNQLIIDPGPQTISCLGINSTPQQAHFAKGQGPSGYTQTFPPTGLIPEGNDITTLGQISADSSGYLYVLGGLGRSGCSVAYDLTAAVLSRMRKDEAIPPSVADQLTPIVDIGYQSQEDFEAAIRMALGPANYAEYNPIIQQYAYPQPRIDAYANNNFWWDDTSDGPITAKVILEGDVTVDVTPSWVLVAPPAYAPQMLNMTTLYDTMYDVFVRNQGYNPNLYNPSTQEWNSQYKPNFKAEILPILSRPPDYQWAANINSQGNSGHNALELPDGSPSAFFDFIREPGDENTVSPGLMPKLAGDNPISSVIPSKYMTLTRTQYFILGQFSQYQYDTSEPVDSSGPGEQLDRAVLANCVGGPFCPGIEMTWVSRSLAIYSEPFRIKPKPASGNGLQWDTEPTEGKGLEPGDVTKYMALPWQADFNECSDQTVDSTTIWWWPAQRPYFVSYKKADDTVEQGFWTRPEGSQFEKDETMVYNWKSLGFLLQQAGTPKYLEVQRQPLAKSNTED
ncbi:hypothetical protein DAT35_30220 [Vitiosangium sp. GDMCC 1.1324]|nr:hypothetical protein DAT35_30220 [Vitiosangium sp. GDMCC 1.1324]